MSLTISSSNPTPYTYPVGFSVGASADVCSAAETIIKNYTTIRNNLYSQLYGIIFNKDPASLDDDTFPLKIAGFIKDVCVDSDAANQAYKFYGCKIINQINRLQDYIKQATALKDALKACTTADAAHEKVVRLQILFQWCEEITDEFSTHYIYDFAEDAWKIMQDNYGSENSTPTQFSDNFKNSFDNLHNMPVETVDSTSTSSASTSTKSTKTIEVFNELNLLDRLKYIKLYYDVKDDVAAGKSEYVFPEGDKSIGYPCEKTEQEEYVAALEKFFMGYLIDRDGPVNAMTAFLDIKVAALRENIELVAKKIHSLNIYLKFINKGLEFLNESQRNGSGRIPEGVATVVIGILGSNMYNTFKDNNGVECLVIPETTAANPEKFYLIKADEAGMQYFITDNTTAEQNWRVDCNDNGSLSKIIARDRATNADATLQSANPDKYYPGGIQISGAFERPAKLDVQKIDPSSLIGFIGKWTWCSGNPGSAVITSWKDAFNTKTKYIDTAIEICNTDIELLRKKIDMLDTLSSTLRRRIQDVYQKNLSKIPK